METGRQHNYWQAVNSVSFRFHCFQVSLVIKITLILQTNIHDTFLSCYCDVSIKYLFYKIGLVSSKKSVSILAVLR